MSAPEWFPEYETQYFAGLEAECLTLPDVVRGSAPGPKVTRQQV